MEQSFGKKTGDFSSELLRSVLYGKWYGPRDEHAAGSSKDHRLPKDYVIPTPSQVRLDQSTLPGASLGVYTTVWIKEGTEIGPFKGSLILPEHVDFSTRNDMMWEVFSDAGEVIHYIDAGKEPEKGWIAYINCARNHQEQNLDICQKGCHIYYKASKDIGPDQELLVWYGDNCNLYFGIPDVTAQNDTLSEKKAVVPSEQSSFGSRFRCVVCRRGFNSRSNLRSHMRIHTLEKPFLCTFCQRSFSQSSTLRNHIRLHTGEKPYRCHVCSSAYSQLAGLRAHQKSSTHKSPAHHPQEKAHMTPTVSASFPAPIFPPVFMPRL